MNTRAKGVWQVLGSGVCFGFLGIFGKNLYENGVKPGELLALRFLIAALLMFIYHLLGNPRRLKVSGLTAAYCACLGIFGYALFSFCFFTALTGLSVALTFLIFFTYPAFVTLGAWVFFGEPVPRSKVLALPLAALGLVGLVWGDLSLGKTEALLYALAAAVFYSGYILASSRWLKDMDPLVSTPYIQGFAGLALAALYLRNEARSMIVIEQNAIVLLLVALVCTALAMSLFLSGLQKLREWEVSLLSLSEPLSGVLLAAAFLGEHMSALQLAGGAAILLALAWGSS